MRRPRHKRPYQSRKPQKADGPSGTLIAHLGVAAEVLLDTGERRTARVKRRSGHVVGDRVQLAGEGLIRLERRNELRRRSATGTTHVIGVNLDTLGIVLAPTPVTPRGFIDRALVAALVGGIQPVLIVNKMDCPGYDSLMEELQRTYRDRYRIFRTCAKTRQGLKTLRTFFAEGMRGAFVGTSGVGKSSLTNELVPDLDLRVGEIREASGLGRHTTTVATLHNLPEGGELVDTPGFREFGLIDVAPLDLAHYFPDFAEPKGPNCRFRDCLHHTEPGCTIRQAVEDGHISRERYETYLFLLRELRTLEDETKY